MPASVSLAMIVKNEQQHLGACLAKVAHLVEEMVVIDTGSTDGTAEMARRLRARVFEFPWQGDFAAARNESLRHCTGEWVFWLDGDERLGPESRERLRELFESLPEDRAAYAMQQRSALATGGSRSVRQVRLFPKSPQLRWRYRVHEQIVPALQEAGVAVQDTGIVIDHKRLPGPHCNRPKTAP